MSLVISDHEFWSDFVLFFFKDVFKFVFNGFAKIIPSNSA